MRTVPDDSLAVQPWPLPSGSPVSLGPPAQTASMEEVNVFWSDRIKDELALRAMRPTGLPALEDGGVSGGMGSTMVPFEYGGRSMENTPPRMALGNDDQRMNVVGHLANENVRLRQELDALRMLVSPVNVGPRNLAGSFAGVSDSRGALGFGAPMNSGSTGVLAALGLGMAHGSSALSTGGAVLQSILGRSMHVASVHHGGSNVHEGPIALGGSTAQRGPCPLGGPIVSRGPEVLGSPTVQQGSEIPGGLTAQRGAEAAEGPGVPQGSEVRGGNGDAMEGSGGRPPSGPDRSGNSSQSHANAPGGGGDDPPRHGGSVFVGGASGGQGGPGWPGGFGGGGAGEVPSWVATLLSQQESIRTVDLPCLTDLGESEIGPLVAGDWLTSITPLMKDLSSSSATWWDAVLTVAGDSYQTWLNSDPLTRLRINPVTPPAFLRSPFARVEQRAQTILLKAIPESLRSEIISNRSIGSIQIIFRVLTRYQPGGLAERTTLLKQLVEIKAPSNVAGVVSSLRSWRRWLVRVSELGINPPDATLLMSALDRLANVLTKGSPQTGFRLSSARAPNYKWIHALLCPRFCLLRIR